MKKQKSKHKILNTKNNKGITLVALIITIIVLLILAVVAVRAITGDGILQYAKNSTNEYEKGQDLENTRLDNYLEKIEDHVATGDTKEAISKEVSFVGCYADVDDNGTVDGIIYADLAFGVEGQWTDGNGTYSYEAKENLNNYYIREEKHTENGFGENIVIAPIDKVEENDRFYVMALEDFTTEDYETFYWYNNAQGNMSDYADTTSGDFGTGRENTKTMMNKVYGDGLIDGDLWKYIGDEVSKGWFVPSRGEWGAFGKFATDEGLTTSNYSTTYGLHCYSWSSSQIDTRFVWNANFDVGYMTDFGTNVFYNNVAVRLSTTF